MAYLLCHVITTYVRQDLDFFCPNYLRVTLNLAILGMNEHLKQANEKFVVELQKINIYSGNVFEKLQLYTVI